MTISSEIRKAGPFLGNDVTTGFPFTFKVFSSDDLEVVSADALGAETTLILNTDYTASINADQNTSPGGVVTLSAALATGTSLVVTSSIENLQPANLTNQGGFYPQVITNALDRLTILIQQLAESVSRSLKFSISTPSGVNPELPTPVPYALISWNGAATGFQNTDPTYSTALSTDLSAGGGAAMLGFTQDGTGAVSRTAQAKMREAVSVNDFGGVSDGVADDMAAINSAMATGRSVLFPRGGNAFSGDIALPANATMILEPGHTWSPAATKHITSNGFDIDSITHPTGPVLIGTGTNSALNTQQFVSGSTPTVGLNVASYDSVSAGAGFQIAAAILSNKSGGTGHREALHVEQISSGSAGGEFVVGANFIGRLTGGSGNAFGLNSYVWVDSAALDTAEACSYEANVDVRRAVVRKVGIQIVDVAASIGSGTVHDAGMIIGSQAGGAGFSSGLKFGLDGTTGFGILSGGKLIAAESTAQALHSGIDFEGLSGTFSAAPIVLPPNNKGIYWGSSGSGGVVESQVATNAGRIVFSTETVAMQTSAAANMAVFTSTESYLMITTASGPLLRRVEADAVDTAGVGYRNLRVGN